ncbi:hypothetical protein [Kitasatospora sp. NPDC090091]|uniref:hypothetical protein n=1 Tax=Kitasatospora sp. NPDC090091 TaxID=3364081 RepID=UPI00381987AD
MLAESLTALAAAGGAAVVQAAGTDAWTGFRGRLSAWLGRGDAHREQAESERLDRTAADLRGDGADPDRARIRAEAGWQARIEALLEGLDEHEREQAAAALRTVLGGDEPAAGRSADGSTVSAADGGVAAGAGISQHAEEGSVAATIIHGGVSIGHPGTPDPSRG